MSALLRRFALSLVLAAGTANAGEVVLENGFTGRGLGRDLELAYDATGHVTFDDVRAGNLQFAPSTSDVPNFGYRGGAEWAHFSLRDRRGVRAETLVLELAYPSTDLIEVFEIAADGAPHTEAAGDHVPFSAWPLDARIPAFPLKADTEEVWVRVSGGASHQLPLTLRTRDAWRAHTARENLVQAVYYGALAAMLIYNALVWAAVGLRIYGFYVAFLLAYGAISLLFGGVAYATILGDAPWLNDHLMALSIDADGVASIAFALRLLGLGPNRPFFQRTAQALTLAFAVAAAASLVLPYSLGVRATYALITPWVLWLFGAGIVALRRGERAGRWFLLAWSTFIVGVSANMLRVTGVLPTNALTSNAHQVGSAVEFLLLSFALADRIKQLQAEATANAELAAANALAAERSSARALEEMRRLDKLKDEFLSNTSHELRTPLNGVIGMAEALHATRNVPGDVRAKTVEILTASRRLSELVATIVDFTGDPSQGEAAPTVDVDLAGVVARVVAEHAEKAAAKGLAVRVVLAPEVRGVRAGVHDLEAVCRALLSNALKFSDFGAIDVRARAADGAVELVFVDHGCGIEAERLPSLFHAFEQGDGSATRKFGGTGLGLALAKKLVERHGGTISVTSTVSVGTTVCVSLRASSPDATLEGTFVEPAAPDVTTEDLPEDGALEGASEAADAIALPAPPLPAEPHAPELSLRRASLAPARVPSLAPPALLPPPAQARAQGAMRGARLLIVDDDRLNRMVITTHLEGTPFACVEASSGAEALRLFQTGGPFDAILLDVMMPGMSGYAVCRALRQVASATDLPVLMLTAKRRLEDLVEGFEAGANDYVHKPVQKGELLARVSAHIGFARASLAMRRFVPREAIRLLGHDDLTEVTLGEGTEQALTVAFSDVRGFTSTLERISPREAFAWLNRAFGVVGPEVRRQGGFIDKYIGDAVMALFPRSPVDAVRAAVAMHHDLARLGDVRMGTGIHLGSTMLGTMGEPERFEATVLSDTVNIASRVEGASKLFGVRVLVTEAVRRADDHGEFSWRSLGLVRLKGRAGAVSLFELLDADPETERAAKLEFLLEFDEAVSAFQAGALQDAALRFERLVDANPTDGPALSYLIQTNHLLETPDGSFDGSFVMVEK